MSMLQGLRFILPVVFFVFLGAVQARGFVSTEYFATQNFETQDRNLLALQFPFVPDQQQTAGSLCTVSSPDFTEYRYQEKIPYCARKVSSGLKAKIYRAYGVSDGCKKEYTIDHFIPLSLGGTNTADNLWPEAKSIKHIRFNLENDLYHRLQKGTITQKQAIDMIVDAKLHPPIDDPTVFKFCL